MKCGIFTNEKGEILLVHREPFKYPVIWIEHDRKIQNFTIVYEDGRTQELGLDIAALDGDLEHGREVHLVYMVGDEIISVKLTVIVVKDY